MLTDEQLIRRIRSSLHAEAAEVAPPANLLSQIRRNHARQRRLRVPRLGSVLTALAAGSAIAVTVLAILLIGHQRSTATRPSAVPPPARGLASELAILRRPQNAVDRGLSAWAIRGYTFGNSHEYPLPGLTRLAATLPAPPASGATEPKGTVIPPVGHVRVFLTVWPATSSPYGPSAGATLTALVISKCSGTSKSFETSTQSVTASQLYAPINVTPCLCGVLSSGPGYNIGIVPDSVARVRWVFNGRYGFVKQHRRPFAVYPTIKNNIAVAPIQRNQGSVTNVTWYAADGRVIRQLNHAWTP